MPCPRPSCKAATGMIPPSRERTTRMKGAYMKRHFWHRWRAAIAHALAIFGIGLAGASAGGDDDEDWLGIGS